MTLVADAAKGVPMEAVVRVLMVLENGQVL